MAKEEAINKLAHIIFDASKAGCIPFNVDGEYCAMSVARTRINEFLSPSSDTTELLMLNLDDAAEVDLEKEFYDFLDTLTGKDNGHLSEDELFRIAKYFYELGLKAKGE